MSNNGYEIEARMRDWFKGQRDGRDYVDFSTSKTLWEVKKCNLFNRCNGTNNKILPTRQLGRFKINRENHVFLKVMSEQESKQAKYVFVLQINKKQIVFKTLDWQKVNDIIDPVKTDCYINIQNIFGGGY